MDRVVQVYVQDSHGTPLRGGDIRFYLDGALVATVRDSRGQASLQIPAPATRVGVEASFLGHPSQHADLAPSQNSWTFSFPLVLEPTIMDLLKQNLPAAVGLVLLAVALALAFSFNSPSPLQQNLILGTFALAGGGIGSMIPGLLNVNLNLGQKAVVTAAGAMAVFVILYFFKAQLF